MNTRTPTSSLSTALALAAAALTGLTACGGSGFQLPDGPSGGDNSIDIAVAGQEQPLVDAHLQAHERSGAITLIASGSLDPYPNAVDDEHSLVLELVLDRAQLAQAMAGEMLAIAGSTRFTPRQGRGAVALEDCTHTPQAGESAAISNDLFHNVAFAVDTDAGEQTLTGGLQLERLSADELIGKLDVRVEGKIPLLVETKAHLAASFDLAIQPE